MQLLNRCFHFSKLTLFEGDIGGGRSWKQDDECFLSFWLQQAASQAGDNRGMLVVCRCGANLWVTQTYMVTPVTLRAM